MEPKHYSRLKQGLRYAATETRLATLEQLRHTLEFDSVLSQQSISGKIVSLILCGHSLTFSYLATLPSALCEPCEYCTLLSVELKNNMHANSHRATPTNRLLLHQDYSCSVSAPCGNTAADHRGPSYT